MSAVNSGSSLRALVLTPQRTPGFVIPSRSPLHFLSPRRSSDHRRLLSDPEESPGAPPPAAASRYLLRLPRIGTPRRATESADTDLTTRAAMSLPHVGKVTAPYGFRAVLAASPCTRRRESLFHRNKPVTVTDSPPQVEAPPLQGARPRTSLWPVRALGRQVMKELRKPAAALRARSPRRRT